jgi:glycosyltransferase involved in cell wall biosynthesis
VALVHPAHQSEPPEGYQGDVSAFYGVQHRFERRTLPTLQKPHPGRFSRPARALPFSAYLAWCNGPAGPPFICYTRSPLIAWIAVQTRRLWRGWSCCRGVVAEIHDEPPTGSAWRLLDQLDGLVVISEALRNRILAVRPTVAERTWVEHDGVDLKLVNRAHLDSEAARSRLGLIDRRGPVVVYTGRAIAGKGVDVLIEAAPLLERFGGRIVVVGKVYEADYIQRAGGNVTFTGFVPPSQVPEYLAAADVLVMPTTEDLPYAAYTSPLKLFEYMASGRPVVASGLPVIREILVHGENALLYPSRSPEALASAIGRAWQDTALASALTERAWRDVQHHEWEQRARRILERLPVPSVCWKRPSSLGPR